MSLDGRYKLIRLRFNVETRQYDQVGIERHRTKAEAMAAYHRARIELGCWPDLIDDETKEYIA